MNAPNLVETNVRLPFSIACQTRAWILPFFCVLATYAANIAPANEGLSPSELRLEARDRERRIIVNNDGCDILKAPPTREGFLAVWSDYLKNTQVDAIFYCPFSSGLSLFTHKTKVGEVLDHPNVKALHEAGLDPLEMTASFAREQGMEIFFSLRMNDTHDATAKNKMFWQNFKTDHPQFLHGTKGETLPHGRWSALEYGEAEVRDRVYSIVAEALDGYALDGVELDFFRHPQFFRSTAAGGVASETERGMMTELIRKIRGKLDEKEKDGQARLLAIRVPDSVGYCFDLGLDIETWMREGLVDFLITTDYFQLNPWDYSVNLARQYNVKFYASLSTTRVMRWVLDKKPGANLPEKPSRNSDAVFNGRSMAALAAGANGVYVFNVVYGLPTGKGDFLKYSGTLDTAQKHPRDYFVSPMGYKYGVSKWLKNGVRYAGQSFLNPRDPEKISRKPHEIYLETGEKEPQAATARLHLHTEKVAEDKELTVFFNDVELRMTPAGPNHFMSNDIESTSHTGNNKITFYGHALPTDAMLLDAWMEVAPESH